jgi:ssDNA-binding Zn-finger/Zn-ribbon topoisomerase 1
MQHAQYSNREIALTPTHSATPPVIQCPNCGSEAVYWYGRTRHHKQRFQCLICMRQFSMNSARLGVANKPVCPRCDKPMHIYKREHYIIRFRCSNYPRCKVYCKLQQAEKGGAANGGN